MSKDEPLVVSDEQLIRLLKDANKKLGDHARLLTKQRDELLAALESVKAQKIDGHVFPANVDMNAWHTKVINAIARVKASNPA